MATHAHTGLGWMAAMRQRVRASVCLLLGLLALPAVAQAPEIFVQLGYKTGEDFQGGRKIAFSSDGKLLAAVNGTSAIRIWETETGREILTLIGHTGPVKCLAFLPDNRRLVSGGRDKTIRLWDLETGRQLRTFWGHPEEVRSVAVSPDGTLLASLEKTSIRIWNLGNGALITTVSAPVQTGGIPGYITPLQSIACSPDSTKVLYTTISGEVTVVGVKERRILATLDHGKLNFYSALEFLGALPDGKVALGGYGSLVFLDLERFEATQKKVPGDVYVQYLSPDGGTIAGRTLSPSQLKVFDGELKARTTIALKDNATDIGYSSALGQVAVSYLGDQLKLQELATGKELQDFSAPAFAARSASFSADGGFVTLNVQIPNKEGQGQVDSWAQRWDLKTASLARFFNLTSYFKEQEKLYKSGDPALVQKASANFKADAPFKTDPEVFSSYDAQNRCFYRVENQLSDLYSGSPLVTIYQIDAKHENDFDARMSWNRKNWKILKQFKAHTQNVSASVVTYRHGLLATGSVDKTINLFSYPGLAPLRTFRGHLGEITGLTFSADGTRLVSESSDMTSRLWDVATGRELGRFLQFTDGEWIVITPEGYYNASANGDRHLNVRVGANVFGIENYREAFFRPDLVKVALAGGTMEGYRTLAEVKPPPKVSIVQTPSFASSEDFKVTLRIEEQGGGIGDLRLYLNGSAVVLDGGRGVKVVQGAASGATFRSYTLKLSPGANTLRAAVFNADNSMQSNNATHQVIATFTSSRKPTLHALVIGIQDFRNPKLALKYAVADANLFSNTLRKGATGLFEQVKITTLTAREGTTRESIISAMQGFRTIHPDDVFILYLASHGTVDDGEYFLITSNVGALSTQRLKSDALPQGVLKELVSNIPSTKKLIVIDTCNAGQLGQAMQAALLTRGMSEDTAIKVLSRAVGSTILSASTSVQEALEGYQGHGLFTWALTQGMLGKADKGRSGMVQTTELAAYVESEVPELAERIFKRAQFPTVSISGQGFPLGKVK